MTIEEFIESYSPLKTSGELKWNNKDIKEIAEQYANEKVKEFAKEVSTKLVDCEDDEEFTKWINTKF